MSSLPSVKRGRPSKGDAVLSECVRVKLSKRQAAALSELATERGVSVSELVRLSLVRSGVVGRR